MSEMLDTLNIAAAAIAKAQALELARPTIISAGQSVQAALDAAPIGAVLAMDTGVFPGSLTYRKPVTLTTRQTLTAGRVDPTQVGSWTVGGVGSDAHTVLSNGVNLIGFGSRSQDPSHQLLAVTGADFVGRQIVLMGDPLKGQHRGLMPHSVNGLLVDSFIDECWTPRTGQDSQAVCGWMDTNNWLFKNNYLGGGAEIVMFGGSDAPSSDRIPKKVTMIGNLLSKRMASWVAKNAKLKNGLELKCIDGFVFLDNIVEYAGYDQGGYVLVLKSCNQDNHAPWSVTQNVMIQHNMFRFGGSGASFVGQDGSNPAIRMNHITVDNNCFDQIDPATAPGGGDGRGCTFQSAVDHLTVTNNSIYAKNMQEEMYFIDPAPTMLTLVNFKGMLPKQSAYGIKVEGVGYGYDKLQPWMKDATLNLTATDTGATGYPT